MQNKFIRLLLTSLLTLGLHTILFAADPTPRPITMCSEATIIIKGDPLTLPPTSYLWESYRNGAWVGAPGVNNGLDYLASSLSNPGTLNVAFTLRRRTVTLGILVDYDSYYFVTVQPILPVTNNVITTPSLTVFCASGDPATITGTTPSSGAAAFIYQWQSSSDNVTFKNIDGAYARDYTPEKITATTYLRRVAISDGCGLNSFSNTVKLTVEPALSGNIIKPPTVAVLCSNGDPAAVTGAAPSGGSGTYLYKWQRSTDNITFTDIPGETGQDYNPPALAVTTYFRRSASSAPCNVPLMSNVVTIQVMSELIVPEFNSATVTICSGNGTPLSVKNPITGITYTWYDSPARTKVLFVGPTYLTDVLTASKTYYVASDNGTCSSVSLGTIQVSVSPLPSSNVVANDGKASTCSGSTAVFSVATPNPDFTYNWYAIAKGGTKLGSGSTWTTPAVTVTTTFYLEVLNKEGCASAARQPVEVTVMPILQAPVVSIESTTQHSITFKWNAVTGAVGYKVSIDNGATYITPSSGSNGLTHTVSGLHGSELVTIQVKATGTLSCQEGDHSGPVTGETVKEFDDIYVPNAFTPNGDGKNDVVYVRSQTVKTLTFYIYSQWGEQLFYSPNITLGWDGTFKGNNQPVGVYVYSVKAIMNNGREVNKKGTITLIR
ncbi:MAG: gliding motility-associated C-terminal domain-containing protein [Bacteroidota bacterium]